MGKTDTTPIHKTKKFISNYLRMPPDVSQTIARAVKNYNEYYKDVATLTGNEAETAGLNNTTNYKLIVESYELALDRMKANGISLSKETLKAEDIDFPSAYKALLKLGIMPGNTAAAIVKQINNATSSSSSLQFKSAVDPLVEKQWMLTQLIKGGFVWNDGESNVKDRFNRIFRLKYDPRRSDYADLTKRFAAKPQSVEGGGELGDRFTAAQELERPLSKSLLKGYGGGGGKSKKLNLSSLYPGLGGLGGFGGLGGLGGLETLLAANGNNSNLINAAFLSGGKHSKNITRLAAQLDAYNKVQTLASAVGNTSTTTVNKVADAPPSGSASK